MKLSIIIALGVSALALAGGGGAYYYIQQEIPAAPVAPIASAKANDLPLGDDWHSVDNYLKLQQVEGGDDSPDQAAKRAERQAELRRRLNPPLLPLHLVADVTVKISPKSHWDDGAQQPQPKAASAANPQEQQVAAAPRTDSLVSDRTQETIATLEAFKTALRATGGEKKFPIAANAAAGKVAAAAPYIDR